MAFPTTAFTDPVAALSAMMNQATENGLSGIVLDGSEATQSAILANLLQGLPASTILGTTTAAAGAGITSGTGTIVKSSVTKEGGLFVTRLLLDLTGLSSSTTDLDIIGKGATPAYITQITAAVNGTILGGSMTCLEVPAGGVTDIDLYAATEGTGVFDAGIGTLTETAVVTSGGAWTLGRVLGTVADGVVANSYLYLTSGAAGTAGDYTAGRYLITLFGV